MVNSIGSVGNIGNESNIKCQVCLATEKLKRCSRCALVYYCSIKCQQADWPEHKKICSYKSNPSDDKLFQRLTTGVSNKDLYKKKTKICHFCKRKEKLDDGEKLKKCMKCRKVYYCSKECQRRDWQKHKKTCIINIKSFKLEKFLSKLSLTEIMDSLEHPIINDLKKHDPLHFYGHMGSFVYYYRDNLMKLINETDWNKWEDASQYYELLIEKNYLRDTTNKKYFKKNMPAIKSTSGKKKVRYFKTTKKGQRNLDQMQKIALDCCLNYLEKYFCLKIEKDKDFNLENILKDEKLCHLIKYRKSFLFKLFYKLLSRDKDGKVYNSYLKYLLEKKIAYTKKITCIKSEDGKTLYWPEQKEEALSVLFTDSMEIIDRTKDRVQAKAIFLDRNAKIEYEDYKKVLKCVKQYY